MEHVKNWRIYCNPWLEFTSQISYSQVYKYMSWPDYNHHHGHTFKNFATLMASCCCSTVLWLPFQMDMVDPDCSIKQWLVFREVATWVQKNHTYKKTLECPEWISCNYTNIVSFNLTESTHNYRVEGHCQLIKPSDLRESLIEHTASTCTTVFWCTAVPNIWISATQSAL